MSHIYCRYEARDRGAGCLLRPTSISPLPPYFSPFLSLGNRVVRVRALAFHQCGAGSIPGLGVICHFGLSFLVLCSFLRALRFSPPPQNQHLFDLIVIDLI